MKRIQNISRFLLVVFNVLLIGLPLTNFLIWSCIDSSFLKNLFQSSFFQMTTLLHPISTPEGLIKVDQVPWTLTTKLIALLSNMIRILPLVVSLICLKSIFKNYREGEIFNPANAKQYGKIGFTFFLDAVIAQPISQLIMVLAVTLSNPPGHRYISLSFGTPNLEVVFFGLLVMVISWVMLEGSRLQEEQRFTV